MIFYFTYLVLLILLISQIFAPTKYKNLILVISLFILFVISSIRGEVGPDDQSYREIFNNANSYINFVQEPLFTFLLYSLKLLGFGSQSLFFLFGFINVTLLYLVIRFCSTTNNIIIVLLYFSHRFLHNDLNLIRQCTASLLFILSLKFFDRNKLFFWVLNIIAISIHIVAILPLILCLLYFYFNTVFNKTKLFLYIVFALLCSYLIGSNFSLNSLNIPAIDFISKLDTYTVREDFNSSFNPLSDIIVYKGLLLILVYIGLYKFYKNSNDTRIYIYFTVMTLVILFLLQSNISIAKRSASIVFVIEPFLFYKLFFANSVKHKLFSYLFIVCISFFQLYYNISVSKFLNEYNTFF